MLKNDELLQLKKDVQRYFEKIALLRAEFQSSSELNRDCGGPNCECDEDAPMDLEARFARLALQVDILKQISESDRIDVRKVEAFAENARVQLSVMQGDLDRMMRQIEWQANELRELRTWQKNLPASTKPPRAKSKPKPKPVIAVKRKAR